MKHDQCVCARVHVDCVTYRWYVYVYSRSVRSHHCCRRCARCHCTGRRCCCPRVAEEKKPVAVVKQRCGRQQTHQQLARRYRTLLLPYTLVCNGRGCMNGSFISRCRTVFEVFITVRCCCVCVANATLLTSNKREEAA
jgi:hypothetical protein